MHILMILLFLSSTPDTSSRALSSLVAAERSFDKTCDRIGIRASFTEFFADSGIAFSRVPYVFKTWAKTAPPPKNPMAVKLHWIPISGGVSADGRLGFTTGPFANALGSLDTGKVEYGMFFSVWEKQAGGEWKVMLDIGTDAPEEVRSLFSAPFVRVGEDARPSPKASMHHKEAETALGTLEEEFLTTSQKSGVAHAYKNVVTESTRVHRDGVDPILGVKAIESSLPRTNASIAFSPLKSKVAGSRDLGYTYGSYQLKREGAPDETGYYCHVWMTSAKGEWKLMAEVIRPTKK